MTEPPKPNPFTDVSPYRPSDLPDVAVRRTGGLTAICIIGVVLGVLGLFSGTLKGINVMFGAQMQQMFGSMGAITPEQAQAQQEMNAAIAAELKRFAIANTILCVAQLILCGTMVYSGLKTLGLKEAGRKLLLAVCVCMLVYETGQLITFVFQQLSMSPIMELYMPRMMQAPNGDNQGAEKFGQIIARMSIIVGVVVQCVWTLVKFVFYAVAIFYLRKATIVALFHAADKTNPPKLEPV
ncbi:MAG: hypothetical protein H6822_33355 [Planctomycetaceae bacterium]|nr:hypothetical protein [Planctomycetales bacterium]MCB9927075.1 hypothetical protein [Planctomycetaceae bacterium]